MAQTGTPLDLVATFMDFYGPGASITIPLPVSWVQFVRSAATVGRDVSWTTVGVDSQLLRYERAWRVAMLRSCLRQSSDPNLARVIRTEAYATLDPSEKAVVSFVIGQAVAKYVAEVMFGCIVFAHIDSALKHCGLPGGGQRPDFIGICKDGRILVIEAKGRSGGLGNVLTTGKKQLSGLPGGDLKYASGSYFRGSELRVAMLDPEDVGGEEVPLRGLLLAYYNPLRRLVSEGPERTIGGRRFRLASFDGLSVDVGLPVELLNDLTAMDLWDLEPEQVLRRLQNRSLSAPPEGVTVQTAASRDAALRSVRERIEDNLLDSGATRMPQRQRPLRRRVRRLRPDPDLREISLRATSTREIFGDDEVYTSIGPAWAPDQMRVEPSDRRPA